MRSQLWPDHRPESENIRNPAGICIFMTSQLWPDHRSESENIGNPAGICIFSFWNMCISWKQRRVCWWPGVAKYWFSVSQEEQMKRFQSRIDDPTKGWKLSPMDLESVKRWDDYSAAKDKMLEHTDTENAPWYIVESDVKKKARVNCLSHLLSIIDYKEIPHEEILLPDRDKDLDFERPSKSNFNYVPEIL